MIRVMLVDENGEKSYIHYDPARWGDRGSSTCLLQERALPGPTEEISQQLAKGQVSGWIGGCRWYLQAGRRSPN